MFAKNRRYFYDQDPLRIPVVSPYSKRGRDKPGLIRRDENRRDLQVISNPLGRNVGSVWSIQRGNYRGKHPATFPPELARRMIVSSCDEKSVVLDVFGGSGTTALVALQLGHRAITIDINSDYTSEARERLAAAPANFSTDTRWPRRGFQRVGAHILRQLMSQRRTIVATSSISWTRRKVSDRRRHGEDSATVAEASEVQASWRRSGERSEAP